MARPRVPLDVLRQLIRRSEGRCERCWTPVCDDETDLDWRGLLWSVQHRKPAGMGGTKSPMFNSPANVVLLCGSGTTKCHGWVEQHRLASLIAGWLVSQYADPAEVPVLIGGGRRVLLAVDWSYADVTE
jgi:hypothetical protein